MHRVKHYGIRGLANKWFYSYLTDRKQFTKINGINSDKQSISTGIPQGSVLGPLLFLLYMNDIVMCEKDYQLRLFADDTNKFVSDICLVSDDTNLFVSGSNIHEVF